MIWSVSLKRYSALACHPLLFGTNDSYGNEQLKISRDSWWKDLATVAVFNAPNGSSTAVRIGTDDLIDVPPEATADKNGRGNITFKGVGEDNQVYTVKLKYTVVKRGDADGIESVSPSVALVDQILLAADTAEKKSSEVYDKLTEAQELSAQAVNSAAKAEEAASRAEQAAWQKITAITNTEIDQAIANNS